MQNNILAKIEKYIKKYKQYKIWQKIVGSLACVVVFVTTYMLILPAITMEQSTFCEMEEHKHSEKCYKQQLICGYEEESETAHVHNESCYETEQVLICGKEESQGHVHDDSCIKKEQVLICTDTSEEHEHTDACYEEQEVYICGMEEGEGAHTHGPECYEAHQVLICDQPENTPVHTHTEACYKKVLICEKEEHTHTLVCFSDPSADVESSKDWERSVSKVKLTGIWADDVIAIAQSQIGYTESTKNYQVQKDGKTIKGYTRYGAWYGDEYGDWCAMFVSFCLNYAEIPQNTVPWESNCSEWIKTLSDSYRKAAGYIPVKGDIIFFDNSGDGTADHVGLVETVNENNGTLKTIEGNASDRVKENSYSVNDSEILGYGVLPENPEMAVEEDKNGGKTEEEETQKIKEAETE
ncbi:MAG: CHAP domain-containing protein, partial [Lachnospiraceae bacterium]|nr:CHAP domain-containing protein [Lachnospiraceae bacterium]